MKKLNKLQINSEKLLKNEELMTIRGGYGILICNGSGSNCFLNTISCGTFQEMLNACNIGCPGTTMPVCFP
jgi:hypothetical protein